MDGVGKTAGEAQIAGAAEGKNETMLISLLLCYEKLFFFLTF